jgi:hypothetical protein
MGQSTLAFTKQLLLKVFSYNSLGLYKRTDIYASANYIQHSWNKNK